MLGNQATAGAGEDIGLHLLTGQPLAPTDPVRRSVGLPVEALQACDGRYRLSPSVEIAVTASDGRLIFRTGERRMAFYPQDAATFFMKQFDVQATFEFDAQRRATALRLTENGRERRAPRID